MSFISAFLSGAATVGSNVRVSKVRRCLQKTCEQQQSDNRSQSTATLRRIANGRRSQRLSTAAAIERSAVLRATTADYGRGCGRPTTVLLPATVAETAVGAATAIEVAATTAPAPAVAAASVAAVTTTRGRVHLLSTAAAAAGTATAGTTAVQY